MLDLIHFFDLRLVDAIAALDDHVELTQRAQILKRVAGADDQVGLLVRLNAAGQITDAREPGS